MGSSREGSRARPSHTFDTEGFYDRLLQAMAQADVTQAELGRRIGRGQATISEWFSKRSLPSGDTMAALPPALGVSYEWLYYNRGPRHVVGAQTDEAFRAGVEATVSEVASYLAELRGRLSGRAGAAPGVPSAAAIAATQAVEDARRTDRVAPSADQAATPRRRSSQS